MKIEHQTQRLFIKMLSLVLITATQCTHILNFEDFHEHQTAISKKVITAANYWFVSPSIPQIQIHTYLNPS